MAFDAPDTNIFQVVERIQGSATTDFGAPARLANADTLPLTTAEIDRLARLLSACWSVFDETLAQIPARTRALKPKVGRSAAGMRQHLLETDVMHLSAFGRAYREPPADAIDRLEPQTRSALLEALAALPTGTPFRSKTRYGFAWTPPFAVRRSAWHALDHAWQLEDNASRRQVVAD